MRFGKNDTHPGTPCRRIAVRAQLGREELQPGSENGPATDDETPVRRPILKLKKIERFDASLFKTSNPKGNIPGKYGPDEKRF